MSLPVTNTPVGPRRLLPVSHSSPADPRDHAYVREVVHDDGTPLPDYDLHTHDLIDPADRDQGQEGCCSGFATATALAQLYWRDPTAVRFADHPRFSPAFGYYEARLREGTENQDSGAFERDECEVALHMGFPLESVMPYVAGQYAQAPTPAQVAEALPYRCDEYQALTGGDGDVEAALAANRCVISVTLWYNEWSFGGGQSFVMPAPQSAPAGAHAWIICGARTAQNPSTGQQERQYRIHNSWGAQWADQGHAWFPASVLAPATYERWVLLKTFPQPQVTAISGTVLEKIVADGQLLLEPQPTPDPQPDPQPTPVPNPYDPLVPVLQQFAQLMAEGGIDVKSVLGL
jgi:hypothetical protein